MEEIGGRGLLTSIEILPMGEVASALLEGLCAGLATEFRASCRILGAAGDPTFAFNSSRQQYHSTEILARMSARPAPPGVRMLGITSADLYIPILTFVFGEAQLEGHCAVISTHRLRQEVYGLPPDQFLFQERLLKESVHELGHTFGLTHCDDSTCVMAASHSVERIDIKSFHFCDRCRPQIGL